MNLTDFACAATNATGSHSDKDLTLVFMVVGIIVLAALVIIIIIIMRGQKSEDDKSDSGMFQIIDYDGYATVHLSCSDFKISKSMPKHGDHYSCKAELVEFEESRSGFKAKFKAKGDDDSDISFRFDDREDSVRTLGAANIGDKYAIRVTRRFLPTAKGASERVRRKILDIAHAKVGVENATIAASVHVKFITQTADSADVQLNSDYDAITANFTDMVAVTKAFGKRPEVGDAYMVAAFVHFEKVDT